MKILLFNGSPHYKGCTYRALTEIQNTLKEEGVDSEIIQIPADTKGCIACGKCKQDGKGCIFGDDDGLNEIFEKMKEADGVVFGSPVYYSNVNGSVRAFADKFFYAGSAYDGGLFDGKIGATVVNCRRGGASAAFEEMNQYFLISNMIVPGSQYWNQTHGFTPEQVETDAEGLQTMRTLAKNIAWILKCIKCAKEHGINPPNREIPCRTNFISD